MPVSDAIPKKLWQLSTLVANLSNDSGTGYRKTELFPSLKEELSLKATVSILKDSID